MNLVEIIKYNNINEIKELLKNNSDINMKDNQGNTPLHLACIQRKNDIVQFLLKQENINVNLQNNNNFTALMETIYLGYIDIIELLINHKDTDIYIQDGNGHTAVDLSDIGCMGYIYNILYKFYKNEDRHGHSENYRKQWC